MNIKTIPFGELLSEPLKNGLTKPKAIRGTGVKMIAMGEIFACSRIGNIEMDRVPVSEKEEANYSIQKGDLLFARQSLVLEGAGKCSIVTTVSETTVFESHLIRARIDPQKANPYYYYYYFNSYSGKENIKTIVEQVAAAGIRGSDLVKLKVPFPSLTIQNHIVKYLSSIDQKIDLNNKINDNLEKQISEIYKAWYQDFVCADDLPRIKTEYGEVPKGWHYKQLGDLCKSVSVTHKFDKEQLIFLNTGDIENGRFLHANYMPVNEMPGQAKKTIAPGDILYSEIRPINKHFAYVDFPAKDYVVSTKLMVIRTISFDSLRLYQYLTSKDVLTELQMQAESRSGTFPQIRFENVSKLPILIADEKTEDKFISILHTVYKQIAHNNKENDKLAELRDTLLPKLITGEINI